MDGCHFVPSPAIDPFKINLLKTQTFPPPDASSSPESAATRNFRPRNQHCRIGSQSAANKMSKTEGFSGQKLSTSCNSPDVDIKGSESTNSADKIANSPEESSISRRKKQRKKGKQNVRLSSFENGLIQPVFSKENNLGNGMSSGDGFVSCADFLKISVSESEALLHTIIHRFSQKNIIVPLENGMDMLARRIFDSGPTGSEDDCCNISTCDATQDETKLINASLSESASLKSKKGNLSDKKSSTGSGVNEVKVKGSMPRGKRSKQRREVERSSSVRNSKVPGTSYTHNGKENSNSWRRVQKNSVAESKKSTALLKKEYFVVAGENAASQTDDVRLLKDKTGWKLKGKIAPALKGDRKNYSIRSSHTVNGRCNTNSVKSKNELGSQSRIILVAQRSQVSLKDGYDDASLMKSFSSLKEWDLFEKRPCSNQFSYREKPCSHSDWSSQNRISDSIAQKWVPIVKPIGSSVNNSQPVTSDWAKKTAGEEEDYSGSQSSPSQHCTKQTFISSSHSACRSEDDIYYTKHVSLPPTDFCKISRAVNEVYRAQIESEAAEIAIGHPIAEFERLLHCSSPIVAHSDFSFSFRTCSSESCRHATPNATLGSLWPWYEQHGSYGLEVRAEDFENPKRLGNDNSAFRAYFVPYLSAVQLFKDDADHNIRPRNGCYEVEYPFLNSSETTSDLELLFEYFESEQPHQRCPLYEKIEKLVRGDVRSWSNMCGDPTNLNSINLHELHPSSWYSVAWYPIYRIPDGNFRAAFLTFHSFGHAFVSSRGEKAGRPGCHAIFPVVGLQSYNAEGECWLQPRQPALSYGWDTIRLLKERLRTLETAASLMARAVVHKGSQMHRNTHPDYEFFLSRRH